jgi:hypothetical protein
MTNQTLIEDLMLVKVPEWWENPWLLAVVPLVIGAILYWVTRWWMRRSVAPLAKPEAEGPPCHEAFLLRLEMLRRRRAELTAYQLAIEVSEILRGYLEARYDFHIQYQTTREFLDSVVADSRFNPGHRAILSGFLGLCDAVKFARRSATGSEQDGLLDEAERFIRECAGLAPAKKQHP